MMKWEETNEGYFNDLVIEYFNEETEKYEEMIVGSIKSHFGEYMLINYYAYIEEDNGGYNRSCIFCKTLEKAKERLVKECRKSAMHNIETNKRILNGLRGE